MGNKDFKFTVINDDGEKIEHTVPGKFVVCYRCEGEGKHVNPNIDGHGISEEEWNGPDWDDDAREGYMNGFYDVTCSVCHGERVTLEIDVSRADPELVKLHDQELEERQQSDYEDRMTRRWENGGYDY